MADVREVVVRAASVAAWEPAVPEFKRFRKNVFLPLGQFLRQRRWRVCSDKKVRVEYPVLAKMCRVGQHPSGLHCVLDQSGRVVTLTFFLEGQRYRSLALAGLPCLLRQRLMLERDAVVRWLAAQGAYPVRYAEEPQCHAFALSAEDYVAERRRRCIHYCKEQVIYAYNRGSGDGQLLNKGDRVFFVDRLTQRIGVGVARYNLNNMWWVLVGRWEVRNLGSHQLYLQSPLSVKGRATTRADQCARLRRLLHQTIDEDIYDCDRAQQLVAALARRQRQETEVI